MMFQNDEGKIGYRVMKVVSRSKPHVANMTDDYQKIQDACQAEKQNKSLKDWVNRKRKTTFIHINNIYVTGDVCTDLKDDWESIPVN